MNISRDEALTRSISAPISPDAPAGVSVRYEPEFEQLQGEIAKLESPAAKGVKWDVVVDIGTQILGDKSKDLQVACYVCRGLYERNSYAGLAQGLCILSELINNYWDTLFPERPRARVAALEWLVEKLGARVSEHKPKAAERDDIASCKAAMEQLEQGLKEKLGDQAIAWGELYRPLRSYADELARDDSRQQKTEQEKQKEAAPASTRADTVSSALTSAVTEIVSDEDVNKSLRTCKEILRKAAVYKRDKSLADPLPYRLLRLATWMDAVLPPVQNNMSQIPQIPAERLAFFEQQAQAGNHAVLINAVESSFANAPFWLDAHRLTAMALEALGHVDAQRVVIIELAAFLRRLPRLVDYQFMGGKPFADDLTCAWINDEVLAGPQTDAGAGFQGASGQAANTPWSEVSREAKQHATRGKFREGVDLFRQGRRQAQSARERFLWDLHQALYCQEAGYAQVAMHQLESLAEEAERYHLDDWEPDLSLGIAATLLKCYEKTEAKSELSTERAARRESMRSRVSRLDLATALDLIARNK